jgi:Tfp pilus assembly protein PilF
MDLDPQERRALAQLYDRAAALVSVGRHAESLAVLDEIAARAPDVADVHLRRGHCLYALNRKVEALAAYERACALKPDHGDAQYSKGALLQEMERGPEAVESYHRALALLPNHAMAWSNLGQLLLQSGDIEGAFTHFTKAASLAPTHPMIQFHLATIALLTRRFDLGWPRYESRGSRIQRAWRGQRLPPPWRGEPLAGKRLLIEAEQGLGDTIQFSRFAKLAADQGAEVVLCVQEGLKNLSASLDPRVSVIGWSEPPPTADYHSLLLSLPLRFAVSESTIPAPIPYLHAEPERVTLFRQKIGSGGFKIGIGWQGDPRTPIDKGRSFPVRALERIAALPGVRLISLQKFDGTEQLANLPPTMRVERLDDGFDADGAFRDTAAVMENLDLVITSDSALVHLAGALGRPAWLALQKVPEWRWMLERTDSPWYPSVRLFRQREAGDWDGLFAEMAAELATIP